MLSSPIDTSSACASDYIPVTGANSCYNPSPSWDARTLPRCAAGFFALEGETECTHPWLVQLAIAPLNCSATTKLQDPRSSAAAAMGVSVICVSADPPPPLSFAQASVYIRL